MIKTPLRGDLKQSLLFNFTGHFSWSLAGGGTCVKLNLDCTYMWKEAVLSACMGVFGKTPKSFPCFLKKIQQNSVLRAL